MKDVKSRECLNCGKELVGKQAKYCSKQCSWKNKDNKKLKNYQEKNCSFCNEKFQPLNKFHIFCSKECYLTNKKGNKKPIENKKCGFCHETFTPTNPLQKYCSKQCQKKDYKIKSKEQIKKINKKWKDNNKKAIKKYSKKWRKNNKEKIKEYNNNNRQKIREKIKTRNKENPILRLNNNIRREISRSLKLNNLSKNRRQWEKLVRYTSQELKKHLEKYFLPGMTWKNYGKWHLDHSIPIVFFRFKNANDPEFIYCWSFNNLRPMWKKDNLKKNDLIILWGKEIRAKDIDIYTNAI